MLAHNVAETSYDRLPADAVLAAKRATLDIIGCMFAGANDCIKENRLMREWGGKPEAPVYVLGGKLPLPNATFLNSCAAYAVDYECGIVFHDMTCTVPVGLTVGDYCGNVSGKEYIAALAAGEDLHVRIHDSVKGDARLKFGSFCPGSTLILFGAAAMAAKLLGLDEDGIVNALGIVFGRCGGTHAPANSAAEAVHTITALSARNGVESALLSKYGLRGMRGVLQSKHGWYNSFVPTEYRGGIDLSVVTEGLGEEYKISKLNKAAKRALKLFPSCGVTHPAAVAALEICKEHTFDYRDIDSIVVESAEHHNSIVGKKLTYDVGDKPVRAEAQFSQPYLIATSIIRGPAKLKHFDLEAMVDPDVVELAKKVTPVVAEDIVTNDSRLHITMKDGTVYSKTVCDKDVPIWSFDQLEAKFIDTVTTYGPYTISKEKAERIVEVVNDLENLENISELTDLIYS